MKAFWLALLIAMATLPASALAQSGELWVVEASGRDAEDTLRLRELLDRPVHSVPVPSPELDPLALARSLGAREVLILDAAHHRVTLLRADGQALTRDTEKGLQHSPYAVPFIAAELLTLAAHLDQEHARRFTLRELQLRMGVQDRWAGEPFAPLWRPSLGAALVWARAPSRFRLVSLLEGAVGGHLQRESALGDVRFVRNDVSWALGADYVLWRFVLRGLLQTGLGLTRAEYEGPYGSAQRRVSGSLGGRLELQARLLAWFSAYGSVGASATLARARYQVGGEDIAVEQAWFGQAELGLMFVFFVR